MSGERLFSVLNRAGRRRGLRSSPDDEGRIFRREFDSHVISIKETTIKWNKAVVGVDDAEAIYRGEPVVFQFLAERRTLHDFLQTAQRANLRLQFVEPRRLNELEQYDLFSRNFGGVTLCEIEEMPLPLSLDDIQKINKVFWNWRLIRKPKEYSAITHAIAHLAAYKFARPDQKITIADNLGDLYQRLIGYFDYYTNILTDSSLPKDREIKFIRMFAWSRIGLSKPLGLYMPARLGIMPASAIKLWQTRAENSFLSTFGWKPIIKLLSESGRRAYRQAGMPDDLERFQHLDEDADRRASTLLNDYYQKKPQDDQTQVEVYNRSSGLLEHLGRLHSRLRQEIWRLPQRRLEFFLKESHPVEKVIVTSQYSQTLIFVLIFRNGGPHLALELDKWQRLYGMPAKLAVDNPLLVNSILVDIVEPFLAGVGNQFPNLERSRELEAELAKVRISQMPIEERPSQTLPSLSSKPQGLPGRLVQKGAMFGLFSRSKSPEAEAVLKRQAVVFYSRKKVEEYLGKKARPKDVDRVMQALRRFEHGYAQQKTIDWSGGKRQVLRTGDLRIILEPLGNSFFNLEAIGEREYVYRRYSDYRV